MKDFKRLFKQLPIWLFVAGLLIIYFKLRNLTLFDYFKRRIKFTKQEFAKLYQVEKRTVNKWMDCFLDKPLPFDKRRKLSLEEMIMIGKDIGNPLAFPALNRTDIAAIIGCSLKELRKITAFDQRAYSGKVAINDLRIFPPILAKRILKRHDITKLSIRVYFRKKGKKLPILFKY